MAEEKENLIAKIMNEPQPLPRKVPDYMRKKGGIWYWTGALVMFAFLYEVITGLVLLFFYQPSNPYVSTANVAYNIPYGTILLTTHLYGAYAMIALMYIHLLRNMFVAGYKKPREQQWLTGVLLFVLTLGAGFFGYSMSGDVLSISATDVGRGIAAGFPYIGNYLRSIFFGNGTSLSLFSRMLSWHIIMVALIGILFLVHFFMAEYNTIMPSHKSAKYVAPAIDHEDSSYKKWYPYNMYYMLELMFLFFGVIIILPSILAIIPHMPPLFSPFPQAEPGTPAASMVTVFYPPWFLLFLYKELDFEFSEGMGPFWATVLFAGMPLIYLIILPKLDSGDSLKLRDRPIIVSFGILGIAYIVGLSIWGAIQPGFPISTIKVLAFFFGIGFVIIATTALIAKGYREKRIKNENSAYTFISAALLIFSLFGLAMLVFYSIKYPTMIHLVSLAIMAVISALAIFSTVAFALGKLPRKSTPKTKLVGKRGHMIAGAGFAFSAVAILSIVSVIPPDDSFNNALYGIGLGIIFLLVGGIIRILRSSELGE
ncbi:MAG: cytochrome bc complex cytochrome b subunit [Thermoplasmatales archaeon]|nr:cytochrome bc complex cytochrome b subunit [Thermoplasmatales archaeon]MCW6170061.1 cytochrome bc complex cytochrome b subunit [Thermoplasmatales archaeon]